MKMAATTMLTMYAVVVPRIAKEEASPVAGTMLGVWRTTVPLLVPDGRVPVP
jgi:hypothetical protein